MKNNKNIDPDEVRKFSSKAQEWWDSSGAFKALHDINPTRLSFITEHISLNNLDVLDLGCGGGILSVAMAKKGARVTGIDASDDNIMIASEHALLNGLDIDYIIGNAEEYSVEHRHQFDLITCMELLEHVPDLGSLIEACATMVKLQGHVVFSTINRNIKSYMLGIVIAEYFLKLLPAGTHQYKNLVRPSELVNWCRESGLKLNDLKGINYNPLLNHCSLQTAPDINYLIDTVLV